MVGGAATGGWIDSANRLRDRLDEKAGKYRLDGQPFAIVVGARDSWCTIDEVHQALTGTPAVVVATGEGVRRGDGFSGLNRAHPGGKRPAGVGGVLAARVVPGRSVSAADHPVRQPVRGGRVPGRCAAVRRPLGCAAPRHPTSAGRMARRGRRACRGVAAGGASATPSLWLGSVSYRPRCRRDTTGLPGRSGRGNRAPASVGWVGGPPGQVGAGRHGRPYRVCPAAGPLGALGGAATAAAIRHRRNRPDQEVST
jgi:hypothetical protein